MKAKRQLKIWHVRPNAKLAKEEIHDRKATATAETTVAHTHRTKSECPQAGRDRRYYCIDVKYIEGLPMEFAPATLYSVDKFKPGGQSKLGKGVKEPSLINRAQRLNGLGPGAHSCMQATATAALSPKQCPRRLSFSAAVHIIFFSRLHCNSDAKVPFLNEYSGAGWLPGPESGGELHALPWPRSLTLARLREYRSQRRGHEGTYCLGGRNDRSSSSGRGCCFVASAETGRVRRDQLEHFGHPSEEEVEDANLFRR